MDMLIFAMTSLIPCNAAVPLVVELHNRLLYEVDEVSSLSAERLRFEVVVEEIAEEGRIGVVGGIPTLSSLESGSLLVRGRWSHLPLQQQ